MLLQSEMMIRKNKVSVSLEGSVKMSNEIKIIYAEVEKKLSTLKSATEAISASFTEPIGGENALNTVTLINELNVSLQSLVEGYKALMLANEQVARDTVETIKQTDELLADSMKWESTIS